MAEDADSTIAWNANQAQEMVPISHTWDRYPRATRDTPAEYTGAFLWQSRELPSRTSELEAEGIPRGQPDRARTITGLSPADGETHSTDSKRSEDAAVRVFQRRQGAFREHNIFVEVQPAGPRDVCSHATGYAGILEVRTVRCVPAARAPRVNDSITGRTSSGTSRTKQFSTDSRVRCSGKDERRQQSGDGRQGDVGTSGRRDSQITAPSVRLSQESGEGTTVDPRA
jgi:hypothetical protein